MEAFTAVCGMCGGAQLIQYKDAELDEPPNGRIPPKTAGISGSKTAGVVGTCPAAWLFPHGPWGMAFQSWFLFGLLPIANGVLYAIVGADITGLRRPVRKDDGGWSSMSGTVYG